MGARVFLPLVLVAAACAGRSVPPDTASAPAPSSEATSGSASDDPMRSLTKSECQSLGQWMSDACASRPNERSARVEGWCSDILRGVGDGTWMTGECAKSIKYIDSVCFRGTTHVHDMMECDKSVHR